MKTLEEMLLSGGDDRLALGDTGSNRFGCAVRPRPDALSFGSCTASSISREAFHCVQSEYESLRRAFSTERQLDARMETLRLDLKSQLGLSETGTEIIFSPSGTDSTLHALFLTRALHATLPLDCLLPASDETGSGVPLALSGKHFSNSTAEGVSVTQGQAIAGLGGVTLSSLPRRSGCGLVRPASCQDQDIWEAVERSVEAGHRVLVQVMDCSKLGAFSPSADCLQRLQNRYAGSVQIVVDACQMRLSRAKLRDYLNQGYLVLISGSKFFTGPPFSGALLVPEPLSHKLKTLSLDVSGLQEYTNRSAWPRGWTALRDSLPDRPNFGQYFRWTAALAEMQAYFSVPPEFRCHVLQEFAAMTTALLQSRPLDFRLLEDASLAGETRTIFPVLVRQGDGWLSFDDATALYKDLAAVRCHIGQPVKVPLRNGEEAGALRICADARLVSQTWAQYQLNGKLACQTQAIETILAEITQLAHEFKNPSYD